MGGQGEAEANKKKRRKKGKTKKEKQQPVGGGTQRCPLQLENEALTPKLAFFGGVLGSFQLPIDTKSGTQSPGGGGLGDPALNSSFHPKISSGPPAKPQKTSKTARITPPRNKELPKKKGNRPKKKVPVRMVSSESAGTPPKNHRPGFERRGEPQKLKGGPQNKREKPKIQGGDPEKGLDPPQKKVIFSARSPPSQNVIFVWCPPRFFPPAHGVAGGAARGHRGASCRRKKIIGGGPALPTPQN